jgi:leucyl aminopeptidase
MKIKSVIGGPVQPKTEALAILVKDNFELTKSGKKVDALFKGKLKSELESSHFQIRKKNALLLYTGFESPARILFVAVKNNSEPSTTLLREAAFVAVRKAAAHKLRTLTIAFDPLKDSEVQAIAEGCLLADYQYNQFKSKVENEDRVQVVNISTAKSQESAIEHARIYCEAVNLVRNFVNEPPDFLKPSTLSRKAEAIARRHQLNSRIFEAAELEKMGAHSFLSVGKGSTEQGRMVHLTYKPSKRSMAHVAFVGKGITFDSGGLSLKTEKGMEHMKSDMAGAAMALALVEAAAKLKLPITVTSILMVTENMPGGGANRPGDVIRSMLGKTIEITNTDAEGRLALADGLTYVQKLKPDYLIDIATLTGAQVVSLGRLMAAVIGNNDVFVDQIVNAGRNSGETMWPLPLFEPYRELIRSDIADIRNSSGIPEAGTIQAALFLSEFIQHPKWVHLDIAGPAWQEREWSVYSKAASGFGVRALLNFLTDLSKS